MQEGQLVLSGADQLTQKNLGQKYTVDPCLHSWDVRPGLLLPTTGFVIQANRLRRYIK